MTPVAGRDELLRLTIAGEQDVFLVRQRGREVAIAVGLDSQDQIRVAAALSDLGRDLVREPAPTRVVFRLATTPVPALVIELSWRGDAVATARLGTSWHTAGRLMDEVDTSHEADRRGIVLVKNLAASTAAGGRARLGDARRQLASLAGPACWTSCGPRTRNCWTRWTSWNASRPNWCGSTTNWPRPTRVSLPCTRN
jgi:hypothetical protein